MVTIHIIQDVVMAPPEDNAIMPPAATREELNDLEKDLHSIKTLHGYTKEEQAAANAKMVEMECAMVEMERATKEGLNDLEKDLHSIKTLHGYTKEEQAAADAKMVEMERAMVYMENKLDAVESELQQLKDLCGKIMKAEIVSLDGVLEKLK